MQLENKRYNIPASFEIKELGEDGTIKGYGSVFGEMDAYREIIAKGAFKKSLKERKPAMLWQHDSKQVVGVWDTIKEDDTGLLVEGRLAVKTQTGINAYELLKLKALNGLSIGFLPKKIKVDTEEQTFTHTELELWEISIVTFPALDSARITSVKEFISDGQQLPSEREFERFLREAGFSRSQSKTLIAKGYKEVQRDAEVNGDEQLLRQLKELNNVIGDKRNN